MKKLYRSKTNGKIAGVCAGLAQYLGVDPTVVRLIVAALVLFCGAGILFYFIAALIIPGEA